MKKHGLFFSVLLVSYLAFGFNSYASITKSVIQNKRTSETRYSVAVERIDLVQSAKKANGYNLMELKLQGVDSNVGVEYKVGYPEIPVVRFLVEGTANVQVIMGSKKFFSLKALQNNAILKPVLASVIKLPGHDDQVVFNHSAYQSNDFWPSVPYSLTPAGSINGQPQTLVTLYPVAYQASTKKFITRPEFIVKSSAASLAAKDLLAPAKPTFAFIVGAQFEKSASLKKYVEMKQKLGFKTLVGVVSKDFTTDVEIREWLKSHLKESLKYALMIGDAEDVPAHESTNISGVTDHFYRAIDTDNYEDDINGPDIGVGRVSVSNETELTQVLNKFTVYQMGTYQADAWLKSAAFLATDDRYEVAEGTHNYVIDHYTSKTGYLGTFPSASEASGGDKLYAITHQATTENVMESLIAGRSVVDYSGHGGTTVWAGPAVSQSDVRSISNMSALPLVISNACVTGQFTEKESFGETWLRHPAAAIAFWGSMDNTMWDEDDILERVMFDGIFKEGKSTLAEITNRALAGVWQQYGGEGQSKYYWETYVLFGDPSIKLRLNH